MYYLIINDGDDKSFMWFDEPQDAINCSDCLYRDILGVSVTIGKV